MWAWMTRCHPAHDRHLLDDVPIMPINPVYDLAERQAGRGPVAVLNCLLSTGPDAPSSTAFADNYPAALRDHILARWDGA
jgi:hypothetical protein